MPYFAARVDYLLVDHESFTAANANDIVQRHIRSEKEAFDENLI